MDYEENKNRQNFFSPDFFVLPRGERNNKNEKENDQSWLRLKSNLFDFLYTRKFKINARTWANEWIWANSFYSIEGPILNEIGDFTLICILHVNEMNAKGVVSQLMAWKQIAWISLCLPLNWIELILILFCLFDSVYTDTCVSLLKLLVLTLRAWK